MSGIGNETIAAIATGVGGGIGIVRVSGPDALAVASRIFRGRGGCSLEAAPPLTLLLGTVADPASGEPLDETLAVWMPAGRSYTGEPTVEIHGHGGRAVLDAVLRAVLAAGARPAAPGEFTRRAFSSGRIDLTQAEAVAELVAARTEGERRGAVSRLQGAPGEQVRTLRLRLLELAGATETLLDHGDEETGAPEPDAAVIAALAADLRTLAAAGERRERLARGPSVVIAGRVNSGKSSIFNVLCDSDRSIVSPQPGTTRDYVAEHSWIDGALVNLIDTAGVRESPDPVEQEGVRRSRALIAGADILVLVIDASEPADPGDLFLLDEHRERGPILVLGKSDLPCRVDLPALERRYPEIEILALSTRRRDGCRALVEALAARCRVQEGGGEGAALNLRHREAMLRAAGALEEASRLLADGAPLDMAAAEIQEGIAAIGEITGESAHEGLLDDIFSRFCIGK